MIKIPQTIANETVEGFNALLREGDGFRKWNAPEIQALRKQVGMLQKVDAREAFVRFGEIAAISGEVDLVLEYFHKALQHPDKPKTNHDFWGALSNVGMYGKAHELGNWLLDPRRGFFQKIWQRAVAMGQVRAVWDRLHDAKKTFPELSQSNFSEVEEAAELMSANKINDSDISCVLDLMGEIQRTHGIMFSGDFVTTLRIMRPPEDPKYLYFSLSLKSDVVEIHAMNRELAKLVVEKLPEGAFPRGVVASFVKANPLELRAAA